MIRQSKSIGVTTLQTQLVQGGNYVAISTHGVSAPLGLSLVYTPSKGYGTMELELTALIDGLIKAGGDPAYGATDIIARGEIWKNGSFWNRFGAPILFSNGATSAAQISAAFIDSIPDNSAPITYSLYGTCYKTGGVTTSYAAFNWGAFGGANFGGGATASYIKITERVK